MTRELGTRHVTAIRPSHGQDAISRYGVPPALVDAQSEQFLVAVEVFLKRYE